jgi:hypothetical protein
MSEETPAGILVVEKIFGLVLIIIGAAVAYFTFTSPPAGDTAILSNLFIIAGIILLGIGVILVLAKTQ